MSDTWASEWNIKQRTNQKAIGQPIGQGERNTGYYINEVGSLSPLVSKWPWGHQALNTREFTAIDVGNGQKVEGRRGEHGHKRKHDDGVGYETPLDTIPSAIDGVEERGNALEEHCNEGP